MPVKIEPVVLGIAVRVDAISVTIERDTTCPSREQATHLSKISYPFDLSEYTAIKPIHLKGEWPNSRQCLSRNITRHFRNFGALKVKAPPSIAETIVHLAKETRLPLLRTWYVVVKIPWACCRMNDPNAGIETATPLKLSFNGSCLPENGSNNFEKFS